MQSVAMGLKLLDGTIVDSSFTPMCFILIMANISHLLCMEVGMHKQVLDIFCSTKLLKVFLMTSNALHTKWMVSLTLPFWEHCSKVASLSHTLKLRADTTRIQLAFSNRCARNLHRY